MFSQQSRLALAYTYPAARLKWGHGYGNSYCFVTLDHKSDIMNDEGSLRRGIRESTNQRYYLLQWEVGFVGADGAEYVPLDTSMTPAYQQTTFRGGDGLVCKQFFLPFENNYLRAAHMLLERVNGEDTPVIRSRALFPEGASVRRAEYRGQAYVEACFPDGTVAVLWGSSCACDFTLRPLTDGQTEVTTTYRWLPAAAGAQFALSFAYAPVDSPSSPGHASTALNGIFDIYPEDSPQPHYHLEHVRTVLHETELALARYLETACLITPDPLLNQGVQWAKVNQLRDQQTYKWGVGFSNNPPCDVVVGRDSVWYLAGSSYYAQSWSKQLFALWFRHGIEENGKYTEYLLGSSEPLFKDDYGLNINDNTPLFIMAAHQYYSLTGDRGFLHDAYASLLHSANYLLSQRQAGELNRYRLVWCTSQEQFVRGLCGWRNCIRDYNLSGAVTEINVECYLALVRMAELAEAVGDVRNQHRLQAAADDLRQAIERHLHTLVPDNPFYALMIDSGGVRHDDMTADILFPALFGVADAHTAEAILTELFSERFWAEADNGGGGIRTVSAAQAGYHPDADWKTYGLMGGVWPNLALWTARAAAAHGHPELCLKALRATLLLADRDHPAAYNVVPGELPEYFNGDNLVQRGQPRSTFLSGILIWAATEGFFGLTPHPEMLEVTPSLPAAWPWLALMHLPYRGYPLSMIAVRDEETLYTTAPVQSSWRQVVTPAELQERYLVKADGPLAYLVIPSDSGETLLAVSPEHVNVTVRCGKTHAVIAEFAVAAGEVVRTPLPA